MAMALLEATNTLLEFDTLQNSMLSLCPLASWPTSLSPDHSVTQYTTSSDDETTVTSLTNASEDCFQFLHTDVCASQPSTVDLSSITSSSCDSPFAELDGEQLPCFDMEDFASGFEAGELSSSSSSNDASISMGTSQPSKKERKGKRSRPNRAPRVPRSTSANNQLPPCRICGDAASGFHYGVNSCEACKRFFRRALKRKRNFKCRGSKNCSIKGKKNNLCGYCRYSRCLALGMSKTAIKTGRYTHEKRAQDILEVQRLVSDSSVLDMPEAEVADILDQLTSAHAKVITNADVPHDTMAQRAREKLEEFRLKKEVFGVEHLLTEEQYDEVFEVTGLDLDERKAHMTFVAKAIDTFVHGYVRFGKGVPGFCDLPLNDQANLLKLARVEIWFLGAYRGFVVHPQVFFAPNRDVRHRREMDKLLGRDYTDYAYDLAASLQKLDLSHEEIVVLKAVCLTFTDRCPMDDGRKVEEIQWRMLRCFLHLLRRNHPGEEGLFHRVMSWLVSVRNLAVFSKQALSKTHFAQAIRTNATLVDMILI